MTRPWTPREIAALGAALDADTAARLGRTLTAVAKKRLALGIAAHRPRARSWTRRELKLLGTMSDAKLAARLGVTRKHVLEVRQRKGVAASSPKNRPKGL